MCESERAFGMKAGYSGVLAAVIVAAAASLELADPFNATVHAWWFALAVTLIGAFLLVTGAATAFGAGGSFPAALASLGGCLLAACVAYAALLIGSPALVPAAPGQSYRPPRDANVVVEYPPIVPGQPWPSAVTIVDGAQRIEGRPGDLVRAGALVFDVAEGPAAHVDAHSPAGAPVTVTQPDAPAFLSPYLTFPGTDVGHPEDYFAVPALHRTVQVDYYAGLPDRGIDIPFLALRISEENGGGLYEGVAVTGRPLRAAGVMLTFTLGAYPVLTESSAPPVLPFGAGLAMVAFGCLGFIFETLRAGRPAAARAKGSR
jgi:hypothetical protein